MSIFDKPFGGVQLLLIGDLQQLAPIVKDNEWELLKPYYPSFYFFHSRALAATEYVGIELKHVYRQQNQQFIHLLNRIRKGDIDADFLAILNKRYLPNFNPPEAEGYITLSTHNHIAQSINNEKMRQLPTREYSYKAEIQGNYPEELYPTDAQLLLKEGAQVMFVKNDSSLEKRYYNGKIGTVTALSASLIEVTGKDDGIPIRLNREEWSNSKYTLDEDTGEIRETVEGTFKQYPLKTA